MKPIRLGVLGGEIYTVGWPNVLITVYLAKRANVSLGLILLSLKRDAPHGKSLPKSFVANYHAATGRRICWD